MVSTRSPSRDPGSGGLGRLREVLANQPAALAYVAGPDLVFEFASDGYRQALGWRDLIGRPYREAVPEVVGQPRFEALREVLRTGEPRQVRGEEVRLRRNGAELEPAYIDSSCQPVRDEAGRVAGVLIFSTDVSDHVRDRQQLEELANSLRRSEERYGTLFETLPHGIIHLERDGSVIRANPAAVEILGLAPGEMTLADRAGQLLHEDGTPYRPDELPAMVALRTGEMVSGVVAGVRNARTGEVRWVRIITAVPDARDAQDQPRRAYAVFTDITEQRRAQAGLRESNRLLGRLREANVLGVFVANEEGIEEANDAFLDIVGYTRDDLEAGRITWDAINPREWAQIFYEAVEQIRRTGACRPYEREHLHRDGHRVPTLIGAALLDRDPLRWATFIVDLTARQRSEQERAELLAREQAARVAADAAQDRLALLLDAGNLVAATGSRQELQDQATQLLVPALADSCLVLQPTAQGMLRAASVVHRDPAKAAILQELRAIDMPNGPLLQAALTQATTQIVTDASVMMFVTCHTPREVTDILRRVPPRSMVVMPMLIGRRTAGVTVLGRDDGRPPFTEADVPVLEELSRRMAIGMANVETFAREHTVAETLQRALMPHAPPEIAGLDVAVRYLPATGGVHVGGDWYDVFPLGRDRVALAIGDVVGHSIGSASVMGQIRSLLRAYALDDPAPAGVLGRTNAAVCQLLPDAVATVLYAVLDLPTGDLAYANAGHPPALLHTGEGHAEYLDGAPGAMLGASTGTDYPVSRRRLAPGARLLLYTDGLIEDRRRDIAEGFSGLARAMRQSLTQTAEQTCQLVQTAMLGSGTRADDVCILAIHLQDQPALLHSGGREAGPQMTEIGRNALRRHRAGTQVASAGAATYASPAAVRTSRRAVVISTARSLDSPGRPNSDAFRASVASATTARPSSVIVASTIRRSSGDKRRPTRPRDSSLRIALVTDAGCTMRRSPIFPIGSEPCRVKASSRSAS
jgi:PAS domain S-box-containing protein